MTRIIHNLKYYDQFALAKPLAQLMSAAVPQFHTPFKSNLIVPIPLHPERERERGYNQAGLLAKELGKLLGLPVSQTALQRVRQTDSQAKLTREERMTNMANAFETDREAVRRKHVLLVDDVCTTGATLFAAAARLKAAGAISVNGLCVARALKL
ncbi:MAG: phosphoribosyltransferase family protein [Chloroflexota bacterium]